MTDKYFILIIFSSIILFGFSCKKNDLKSVETIKYGRSFGKCIGYCKSDLTINNQQVIFTKSTNGNQKQTISCVNELDKETLDLIVSNLNLNYFNDSPPIIGCPDCADGGAEYVEINNNGNIKRITFEYGNPPKQLLDLVNLLKIQFKSFENCN